MGGCQSSDGDVFAPKLTSVVVENRFKTIEKRVFIIPQTLQVKLEPHTSNGSQYLMFRQNHRFYYQK